MGGILQRALVAGSVLGVIVGLAARMGWLSEATVGGLIFAVFFGAWLAPGYDDCSGFSAIPAFLLAWGVCRWLGRSKGTGESVED
jgi:hypothetical protein